MSQRTKIYSIFGQTDAVIAEAMAEEGKAYRIASEMIPPTALFDSQGRKALLAIVLPDQYAREFTDRTAALRA